MSIGGYSQALSEAEADIKTHWQQVLDGVEERGSVAYIFEVRGNKLFLIQKAIGHIEPVIEQLYKSKIISKKLYDNIISDLETLNSHINEFDKGHEDIERWFEEAKQYVTSAIADIQSIKSVIEGEIKRRQSIAARFRKGAKIAASIGAFGATALGASIGTSARVHAQERLRPATQSDVSHFRANVEVWQREAYQREIVPLLNDSNNHIRYLREYEYIVPDSALNIYQRVTNSRLFLSGLHIGHRIILLNTADRGMGFVEELKSSGYSNEQAQIFRSIFITQGVIIIRASLNDISFKQTLIHERFHVAYDTISIQERELLINIFTNLSEKSITFNEYVRLRTMSREGLPGYGGLRPLLYELMTYRNGSITNRLPDGLIDSIPFQIPFILNRYFEGEVETDDRLQILRGSSGLRSPEEFLAHLVDGTYSIRVERFIRENYPNEWEIISRIRERLRVD